MDYYKKNANMRREVDKILKLAGSIDYKKLILEILRAHEVGERSIKNYLSLLEETGDIEITGGVIQWKTGKD